MVSRLPLALLPLLVCAQGSLPRPSAADYPVHGSTRVASIGAEFMLRSFSGRGQTFVAGDYLVVEVAVFPARGETLLITTGQFTLRVNGKKTALLSQTPGMVAAGLKYADWEQRSTLVGSAGMGDRGVIIGRPVPTERFPGDNRETRGRAPTPPRAPQAADRSGAGEQPPVQAHEVVLETALAEGQTRQPVSGFVYFPFKGKTKSLKSAELIYTNAGESLTLKLR